MDIRTKHYIDLVERRANEFPAGNKKATLGWFHLVGTADMVQRFLTPFAQSLDLSLAGWGVLNLLHYADEGSRPMHQLSQLLLVSRQNVTQLVDGLEKKRLVERTPCPKDGRVKLVTITRKGSDLVLAHRQTHQAIVRSIFETLRDPELDLLGDYLLRIQGRIEELGGAEDEESEGPKSGKEPRKSRPRAIAADKRRRTS